MVKAFPNMHVMTLVKRITSKPRTLISVLAVLLCLVSSDIAQAQNSSNKGTDFWVGFMNHRNGTSASMYLYITADSNTSGTVSVPGQSWSTTFSITANQMTLVQIPTNTAYVSCSDCIQDRGIHVVSNKPIVVYSHIYHQYCSDATLVLPTPTTGKEYYAMSYEQRQNSGRSQFMIIASKDDTKVRITPTVTLSGSSGDRTAGNSYEITLDKGECYQGRAKSAGTTQDVTGTHIEVIDTGSTSDCRTVAVYSGSSDTYLLCGNAGGGLNSRDNLYQQLYPTRSWGTRFVTIPFKGRTVDNMRIVAAEDNTNIIITHESGPPTVKALNAGERYDLYDVDETKYILAGKPICVAQYQTSRKCGGNGDPSMTILNPIEQTLKKITVYSSEYEDIDDHYINVIIPNAGVSTFRIDGNTATFKKVPKYQNMSYAQITVTKGNHQMSSDVGFLAIAYGFARYESYGYSAGANIRDLTAQIELVNSAEQQQDINSICLGDSAEFEGQAEYKVSQWIWDFGDGTRDTAQFPNHQFQDTGTFQVTLYTYKVLFDGCSTYDSTLMEVRVNAKPISDFGHTLLCEKATVNFYDSSIALGVDNIISRQWIFHNNSTKYAVNSSFYYDTSGQFDVRFIVKTDHQCTDTMKKTITISPIPVADFTVDDVCFFDSTEFVNTSTVRTGSIAINKWYFGDGDSSDLSSPKHFYGDSGTYIAQLIITSDSGCTASTQDTLLKHPRFILDFDYADTCASFGVDFTNTSFADAGTLTNWKWKFPGSVEYTTKDANHQFSTPGTYDVTLVGSLDTLCRDSITHQVQVDPNVNADFGLSSNCLVDTITFTNTSTMTGGTLAETYWDFDDGMTSTQDTAKVKYTTKGSKDIQMIAVSDQGCRDTSTLSITIYNPRIIGFNIPNICQNTDADIAAIMDLDGDSVTTWDWTAAGTKYTSDTVKVNLPNTGRYEITLDATTKFNCKINHQDSFNIYAQPTADFTIADVCIGEDLAPVNTSTIQAGEVITSNVWRLNGNQVSTQQNPVTPASTIGTNTVRLTVTSTNGCYDIKDVDVEVYPLPIPRFTYVDTCLGDNTTFTSGSTISSGSITSEDWTYNDGTQTSGSVVSRFLASPAEYSIQLVATSAFGCKDSISKSFNIAPKPLIDIVADPISGCQPLLVTFTNNSTITTGTITQYNFDFGDGNTSTVMSPSNIYQTPNSYIVTIDALSDAGCRDTLVMANPIDVWPKPVAAFSFNPDEPSLLEPAIQFVNESSADATTFNWSITDGTTHSGPVVDHTLEPGDYVATLIAIAANGCSDTTSQNIHVKLDFFLHAPTAFSPNGDLINDLFGIDGMVSEVQGYTMSIFNRWGEQIFSSSNPIEKWDGRVNGHEPQSGSYMYLVRYRNIETERWETLHGHLTIIR
jgi:gliding motility-associated-like protein